MARFIAEGAIQHQYFFTQIVGVHLKLRAYLIANDRSRLDAPACAVPRLFRDWGSMACRGA
jgi:hypothetical protein